MSTSTRVTSTFLNTLKTIFPASPSSQPTSELATHAKNPWYIVAAVAFSASNRPDGVQRVFESALEDLRTHGASSASTVVAEAPNQKSTEHELARKLREALFRSGLISGYPKAINGLRALHEVTPKELQDGEVLRDTSMSLNEYETHGTQMFKSIYGDQASAVQSILDAAYPDMGWFSKAIGYGVVYGGTDILAPLEFSYTLIAALIAGDTPQQITWHLDGARRGGARVEEVRAVRQISMEVSRFAGVEWKYEVPDVQ